MTDPVVITFTSTHAALEAEDVFKQRNIDLELVPTPRKISSECGFALLVRHLIPADILLICQNNNIKFESIYKKIIHDGGYEYEKNY
jgi:hypothetical protein